MRILKRRCLEDLSGARATLGDEVTAANEVRLVARDGNAAVVHLSGRAFPAFAIQGDTLFTVVEALRKAMDPMLDQREDELQDILNTLTAWLNIYQDGVLQGGGELPYFRDF